jgi:glycosyltransferase involved in cell wall biosynthesis
MKVSIIIPAFNEMHTIERITTLVKNVKLSIDREIIIVNDGSMDKTHEIASKLQGVKYIKLERNMGKGVAVRTGIAKATGEIVLIQDADLEYHPKDIPRIVSPIVEGEADVVFGSRFLGSMSSMTRSHLIANRLLTLLTRLLCGVKLTDMMTGYKAFKREALAGVKLSGRRFELEPEITARLAQKKLRIIEVPITYEYRKKGLAKIRWYDGIRCIWWLLVDRVRNSASSRSSID